MSIKKILERKYKNDGNSRMNNEDVNKTIKEFARSKRDSEYYFFQDERINNYLDVISLNPYKQVQILKTNVSQYRIKTLIVI